MYCTLIDWGGLFYCCKYSCNTYRLLKKYIIRYFRPHETILYFWPRAFTQGPSAISCHWAPIRLFHNTYEKHLQMYFFFFKNLFFLLFGLIFFQFFFVFLKVVGLLIYISLLPIKKDSHHNKKFSRIFS